MMNETANYPGQPWMWLYTFWYQVKPFSTSDNADALVWALMAVLTLGLILLPFIPGRGRCPAISASTASSGATRHPRNDPDEAPVRCHRSRVTLDEQVSGVLDGAEVGWWARDVG
jgi:hypothetical protein